MDIAALSVMMSQSNIQQDSSIAVMKKAMDTTKTMSTNLTEMLSQTKSMEMSLQPNLGGSLDTRV